MLILIKKISLFWVYRFQRSFCLYHSACELCTSWSFLQELWGNRSLGRRLLAHPGQKGVEFWKQWHLCRVTAIVLHLLEIQHGMVGPLSRQFELTMSGCWHTPFSCLYSKDGVPLFPQTLQSRYWSWTLLVVVLSISLFLRPGFRPFCVPCSLRTGRNIQPEWILRAPWCLWHLCLLFWLLTCLLACAAKNVRRESRLFFRNAGSPYISQDFPLEYQLEDPHLVLTFPEGSFPSFWSVWLTCARPHEGHQLSCHPSLQDSLLPSPFKMPALSYHVNAPSLEVVELQLDVQVVPTGRLCLELVWEAGAVGAQSRKGLLIKLTWCLCLYFADQA